MMIASAMIHLSCGYMTMDWQAFYMIKMPGLTSSWPWSDHGCAKFSQIVHHAPTLWCETFPPDMMIAAVMFHLSCRYMAMDCWIFYMIKMPGLTSFWPWSDPGCAKISQIGHCLPTLWCETFPPGMMIAAAMIYLSCGYITMNWQAFYMIKMSGLTSSWPWSDYGCAQNS